MPSDVESIGPVLLALEGGRTPVTADLAPRFTAALAERFPGLGATVLAVSRRGGQILLDPMEARDLSAEDAPLSPPVSEGGIPGPESATLALLRELDRTGARAVALVTPRASGEASGWMGTFLAPILEEAYDFVCPTYLRHKTDATLNTGVVYPLTRALYGWRIRQPLGGEFAMSLSLGRRLLADPDWRRDPRQAGSDAWLVAKAFVSEARVCQAWLGEWPGSDAAAPHEEASQTLSRVLGLLFREMERHASRWQRVEGSRLVATFGTGGLLDGQAPAIPVDRLVEAFRLGQRELSPVWSLVLPPTTLLTLKRTAGLDPGEFCLDDGLWARIVYDFAVAHFARLMERGQLLRSMTPLYLGWVAGFVNQARDLAPSAVEARVEALCEAFEREKPRLIARWRWPDGFSP